MDPQTIELNWLALNTDICKVCGHRNIFHVRCSGSFCIVDTCTCDGQYSSVEESNAARLVAHIMELENCVFDKGSGHVDSCSICQEHIATNASDKVYEFYNYSKSYRRS